MTIKLSKERARRGLMERMSVWVAGKHRFDMRWQRNAVEGN